MNILGHEALAEGPGMSEVGEEEAIQGVPRVQAIEFPAVGEDVLGAHEVRARVARSRSTKATRGWLAASERIFALNRPMCL